MRGLTKLEIHTFKLMNKNLPTIKQSTEVALSRANTLMDVADKILAKQSTDLVDESWMERLWQWADDNYIDDATLPRDRDGLIKLTGLQLIGSWDNQLTELPKEIGNLVNLTWLIINYKQLTELPKEIGNLVNLTELILWDNQLTELPKEVGSLVNLTELTIDGNQLTKLPKEIGNLVNLTELSLWKNQLTELPKEITNLVNLTKLYLGGNQLTELPKELQEWFDNIEYRHI